MNKKVISSSIICLITFALTMIFITSNYDNKKNKVKNLNYKSISLNLNGKSIAYVPLDDRPVNLDRVKYLAKSIGYDLQLPPDESYKTYLQNMGKEPNENHYGSPQAIAAWLDQMENNGCDYYIISMDQLFSGGLVGSRYLNDSDFRLYDNLYDDKYKYDNVKNIFEKIINDSNNKVYLLDSIMRLASTVGSIDPETQYYLTLDDYYNLYAFGSKERQLLSNNNLTIENIVNGYKKDSNGNNIGTENGNNYSFDNRNMDKNLLNKYLNARERKLRLYDYYINIINNKSNVFLTVTIDDSSQVVNNIQRNEINYINKISQKQLYIRDGIDEQGLMMLAKLAIDIANTNVNIGVKYYGGAKETYIGLSNSSYEQNFNDLLNSARLNKVDNNPDIEVLIYINPNDNTMESTANALIEQYKNNIINHIPTIIIDSQDNKDNYLQNKLIDEVPLGYLLGYSRWNVFCNSSGIALSNGIARYLYLISNDKPNNTTQDSYFINTMVFSFLKDTGYISNLRSIYGSKTQLVPEALEEDMITYKNSIANNYINMSNYISDLTIYEEKGIASINVSNYRFPWKRSFEISFDVQSNVTNKKFIHIKYHSNTTDNELKYETININTIPNYSDNVFTRSNYILLNWNTKADGSGDTYELNSQNTINNDLDLYANWIPNKYTLTYNYNGANIENESMEVNNNTIVYFPQNVERTGYKFIGWNDQINGEGNSYNNSYKFATKDSIVLYAQWEPISYNIILNANNGTTQKRTIQTKYDEDTLLSTTFTNNNYSIIKWCTSISNLDTCYNNEQVISNLSIVENTSINLYAIWNKVQVKYIANNGTDNEENKNINYGNSIIIGNNNFTYNGYEFKNWNTKIDGSGTTYYPNDEITSNSNIKLYAIWEKQTEIIIRNYNIDEEKRIIDDIDPNTNKNDYLNCFELEENYRIELVNDSNIITTGSKIKIYKNNALYKEYINIIRGDVTADGKITSADYIKVKKHIMDLETIDQDNAKYKAADVNKDNKITSADYVKIKKYIMGIQ